LLQKHQHFRLSAQSIFAIQTPSIAAALHARSHTPAYAGSLFPIRDFKLACAESGFDLVVPSLPLLSRNQPRFSHLPPPAPPVSHSYPTNGRLLTSVCDCPAPSTGLDFQSVKVRLQRRKEAPP
jgi:hypothetical protein